MVFALSPLSWKMFNSTVVTVKANSFPRLDSSSKASEEADGWTKTQAVPPSGLRTAFTGQMSSFVEDENKWASNGRSVSLPKVLWKNASSLEPSSSKVARYDASCIMAPDWLAFKLERRHFSFGVWAILNPQMSIILLLFACQMWVSSHRPLSGPACRFSLVSWMFRQRLRRRRHGGLFFRFCIDAGSFAI